MREEGCLFQGRHKWNCSHTEIILPLGSKKNFLQSTQWLLTFSKMKRWHLNEVKSLYFALQYKAHKHKQSNRFLSVGTWSLRKAAAPDKCFIISCCCRASSPCSTVLKLLYFPNLHQYCSSS